MNLKEVNNKFHKATEAYWKRSRKLDAEIKALQDKKERLRFPEMEKQFGPLMDTVRKLLKKNDIEWMGPFGMNGERSCYFGNKPGDRYGLHFVHRSDGYHLRNYGKKVNTYPAGSIAEMNGDNFEVIEPTKEMTPEWLAKLAKKR